MNLEFVSTVVPRCFDVPIKPKLNGSWIVVSSFLKHFGKDATFAGLTDGRIVGWLPKLFGEKTDSDEPEYQEVAFSPPHNGCVKSMAFFEIEGNTYLASGGIDRRIRLWDPWMDLMEQAHCFQVLVGHGGTVNGLSTIAGLRKALVSASSDKTIRLWRHEKGRSGLLVHPWLQCEQVIDCPTWVLSLGACRGENTMLFGGDDQGIVRLFAFPGYDGLRTQNSGSPRRTKASSQTGTLALSKKKFRAHRLGISQLQYVEDRLLLLTIGNEGSFSLRNAEEGTVVLTRTNPRNVRYCGVTWLSQQREVLLVDVLGYLEVISILTGRLQLVRRIKFGKGSVIGVSAHFCPSLGGELIVVAGSFRCTTWVLHRASDVQDIREKTIGSIGIRESIIALTFCLPQMEGSLKPIFVVSASVDGLVRGSDCMSFDERFCFRQEESEIRCIASLPRCNVIATGSADGYVRFINIDLNSTISLCRHENSINCLIVVEQMDGRVILLSGDDNGCVGVWNITPRPEVSPVFLELVPVFGREAVGGPPTYTAKYGSSVDEGLLAMLRLMDSEKRDILCAAARGCRGGLHLDSESDFDEEKRPRRHGADAVVFVGGNCGIVRILEAPTFQPIGDVASFKEPVSAVQVQENLLYIGLDNGQLRVWNVADCSAPYEMSAIAPHSCCIRQLESLGSGAIFATCSSDKTIAIVDCNAVDPATGNLGLVMKRYSAPSLSPTCFLVDRNSARLIVGTASGTLSGLTLPAVVLGSAAVPKVSCAAEAGTATQEDHDAVLRHIVHPDQLEEEIVKQVGDTKRQKHESAANKLLLELIKEEGSLRNRIRSGKAEEDRTLRRRQLKQFEMADAAEERIRKNVFHPPNNWETNVAESTVDGGWKRRNRRLFPPGSVRGEKTIPEAPEVARLHVPFYARTRSKIAVPPKKREFSVGKLDLNELKPQTARERKAEVLRLSRSGKSRPATERGIRKLVTPGDRVRAEVSGYRAISARKEPHVTGATFFSKGERSLLEGKLGR